MELPNNTVPTDPDQMEEGNCIDKNLPDADRFDEFALGVKKKFRPEWLDSENKMFINKMNFVCKNFEETHKTTKKLKSTVFTEHKMYIDDLEIKLRDLKEEHTHTRARLEQMENHLPKMIREMIDLYTDQKLNPKFEELVKKRDYEERMRVKMDYAIFTEYCRKQQQNEALNDKEFKTDERLFLIEQKLENVVAKEELKAQLKMKANNDRFIELRENMHKLQVMSVTTGEKYEKEMKKMESDLGKRTAELNEYIHDIRIRVKTLEDEINEDGEDGDAYGSSPEKGQFGPDGVEIMGSQEGDDNVNLGEAREKTKLREKSQNALQAVDSAQALKEGKILQKMKSTEDDVNILQKNQEDSRGNLMSLRDSKTSLKQTEKKRLVSKGKRFQDDPAASGVKTSSKPEHSKKKKKGGAAGLDKESRDLIKNLESKVEELRKSSFGEINRLEAMMEKETQDMKQQNLSFTNAFKGGQEQLAEEVAKLRQNQGGIATAARKLSDEVKVCQARITELSKANPEAQINKIQRKLIQEVVVELITPMKQNMNVDLKSLRKIIEECMRNIKNHAEKHKNISKALDDMNLSLVRALKNSDIDKNVLDRELKRMQHIDRLKVAHAKDSIFNPDRGTLLPSLDTAHASGSNTAAFMTQSQALTPQPPLEQAAFAAKDFMSMVSEHDIITRNEIKGICERMNQQPTQRQRIIIARSQEPTQSQYLRNSGASGASRNLIGAETDRTGIRPQLGSLDGDALENLNRTHHFKNDSKMSIQEGEIKKYEQYGFSSNPGGPLFTNSKNNISSRPFDRNMQSPVVNFKDHLRNPHLLNTIQPSRDTLHGMNQMVSGNLEVTVQTPEIPNAMERIRQKTKERKEEAINKQKRMAEQLEKSREEVLTSYNIKSVL